MAYLKRILLPGVAFQSVVVAGGYGTGRELVEFFYGLGLVGGMVALFTTGLIWAVMCGLTFAFARKFQAYDYRTFFQLLLGRGWIVFEVSYIALVLIVLSIVVSSCGSLLEQQFGFPYYTGVLALASYILFMLFQGSRSIERMFSLWTIMLYTVFSTIFAVVMFTKGSHLTPHLTGETPRFFESCYQGIRYAGYNLGLIPAVLFTVCHLKSQKEALQAGVLAGVLAIVPAMMVFMSIFTAEASIQDATVPIVVLLDQIGSSTLIFFYYLVMIMTLIETGVGLLHSFSVRVVAYFGEEEMKIARIFSLYLSASIMVCSVMMAHFGLVHLISKGYGMLTWIIIAVYLVPLTTIGVMKLCKRPTEVLC